MSFKYPQVVPESAFRRSIPEMFEGLDVFEQRALIDMLALSPAQVDQLTTDGVLAAEIIGAQSPNR